ncbi:MAG: hypothetical protein NTV09_13485 [Bacteroidetes bacterium]|nr:hypothetical protein [Bacteroidota bacterium]
MKRSTIKNLLLLVTASALLSFDLPTGWFKAGNKPNSYEMGIDKGSGQDGKNAATIKSIDEKIDGFGTLMQQSKPDKFMSKRVRMRGFVKSEKVTGWAGLWLRIDQTGSQKPLSIDNMRERPIKGTTPWTKYEIVLDVSENASVLAYGALLDGTGQIWFDNIAFEIVGENVPTTGVHNGKGSTMQSEPSNLDFEK